MGEGFGLLGLLATPTPPGVDVRVGDKMEGEPKPAGLNWTGLNDARTIGQLTQGQLTQGRSGMISPGRSSS